MNTLHLRDARRVPRLVAAAAAIALSALPLLPFAWQRTEQVPAPQAVVVWLSLAATPVPSPRPPSAAPDNRSAAPVPAGARQRSAVEPAPPSTAAGAAAPADTAAAIATPAADERTAAVLPAAPAPARPASAPLDLGSQVIGQAHRASKSQTRVMAANSGAYIGDQDDRFLPGRHGFGELARLEGPGMLAPTGIAAP